MNSQNSRILHSNCYFVLFLIKISIPYEYNIACDYKKESITIHTIKITLNFYCILCLRCVSKIMNDFFFNNCLRKKLILD